MVLPGADKLLACLGSPETSSLQIWLLWLFWGSKQFSLRTRGTVPADVVCALRAGCGGHQWGGLNSLWNWGSPCPPWGEGLWEMPLHRGFSSSGAGGQMCLIAGPEAEPRVIKCFPSLFGNLWRRGRWDTELSERWSVSGQERFLCWIYLIMRVLWEEREFRMFSAGCRVSLNGFFWKSFTGSEISEFTDVLCSMQNAGDMKSVVARRNIMWFLLVPESHCLNKTTEKMFLQGVSKR